MKLDSTAKSYRERNSDQLSNLILARALARAGGAHQGLTPATLGSGGLAEARFVRFRLRDDAQRNLGPH